MTLSDIEAREGSAIPPGVVLLPTAEGRAQARDDTPPPSSIALDTVTQGARSARRGIASAAAALDRQGSLIHAQPPTFAQSWGRHAECARHSDTLLFRWPRYAWGAVHVAVVKPALNAAEWITESPARFAVALAVAAAIWWWG